MRVIFMGTPAFAVPTLQALLDARHEVMAVYTQPPRPAGRGMKLTPSPVQQLAHQHGVAVFTPTSLRTAQAQAEFAAHGADIAVVAAYGLILPQAVLDAPEHGCINIHPSDLPRWRGAAPLQRTIMAGDRTTACCIMRMDAGLDTGPVLLREPFTLPDGMDFGQLQEVMAGRGAALTLAALDAIADGSAHATPQAQEGVTYAAKLTKADQWLDFSRPAAQLRQHALGLLPAPGGLAKIGPEILKIHALELAEGDATQPPGTVLDSQLRINCGDGGAVRILAAQRPNKARQPADALLQAYPVAVGARAECPPI